jgi:(p)ppGpp synthase/HD superfamily hydrolase
MIYTQEIQNLLNNAKNFTGMSLGDFDNEMDKLTLRAISLVKERIKGERKGLQGEMNYLHSMRVYETVKSLHHWDDPDYEMFLGALLHDIVEDGGVSFEELVNMGFTKKTIELVYLSTHSSEIKNKTERWTMMISRLIEARNEEAWCIKLIDLSDNLTQCSGLTEENRKFMIEVKAPLMIRLTEQLDNGFYRKYRVHLMETLEDTKLKLKV